MKEARADVDKPLDKDLEIFSLENLSHPNVVSVMGFWDDPSKPGGPPCIVMEYCEMSLPEYLRENKGALKRSHGSSSATEIKIQILLQVVRGLIYLHQQDVLHGDLRSSNVLIQRESKESDVPSVKVGDYGFCQHVDPHTKARRARIMCEVDFLPPEMLCDSSSVLKNATLTPQVDVFMFGDVAHTYKMKKQLGAMEVSTACTSNVCVSDISDLLFFLRMDRKLQCKLIKMYRRRPKSWLQLNLLQSVWQPQ